MVYGQIIFRKLWNSGAHNWSMLYGYIENYLWPYILRKGHISKQTGWMHTVIDLLLQLDLQNILIYSSYSI